MNQHAAIDIQRDAGAVSPQLAGEENAGATDVFGAAQAGERDRLGDLCLLVFGELAFDDVGADQPRRDAVDTDALGADSIRVNCITPGLIQTDIQKGKLSDERRAEIAKDIPLGRLGVTDDVAGACLYLASDLSSYCTGITLDVNGGMLIH